MNIKLVKNNKRLFLFFLLSILSFIYYYFGFHEIKNYVVELFENNNIKNNNLWSEDLKQRFLKYQSTMSKNDYKYNLEILQHQVTAQEVEEYLKTGYWNWDETLKKLYLDKVQSSTLVNILPEISLDYAMKMYTPEAVKHLLAWNYKEGEFLLYGAKNINDDIVKCSTEREPTLIDSKNKKINNEDIPGFIPGFSFIDEPCNPCVAINDLSNQKCAFKLNVSGNDTTSEIWKRIWKI